MNEDEQVAIWLDSMLRTELDLRPSRGVAKETRRGTQTPRVILLEDGEIAGYAELRRTGGAIELATVVVEPKLRGKGLAHQIVHQAWERWQQDPVLHGAALGGHVDLVKATHDETGPVVVRGPLISFTRDAAMAASAALLLRLVLTGAPLLFWVFVVSFGHLLGLNDHTGRKGR